MSLNFTWLPDLGAQQKMKPAVVATKFGDGYELRSTSAINSAPKSWVLTFTKAATEAMQILEFLEARGGLESFDWVDPLNAPGKYVCREWSAAQQMFGVYVVNATFDQVFEY